MAEPTIEYYFLEQSGNRRGPLTEAGMIGLIAAGIIQRETPVWHSGMQDWRPAGEIPAFVPPLNQQASSVSSRHVPAEDPVQFVMTPAGALVSTLPVWSLLGRSILVFVGIVLIVPAPWVCTSFYRFVCYHTHLPDGRRLTFSGIPGDIWLVFVANGMLFWATQIHYLNLVAWPLIWALHILVYRWAWSKVGTEDGSTQFSFTGGVWRYIGWNILLAASFLTIIGWAWVLKFMMRWLCRQVRGTSGFEFTASAGAILGRSLLFGLLCIFVIPFPWALRSFAVWYISQFQVVRSNTEQSATTP